jgi:hypothetical protein
MMLQLAKIAPARMKEINGAFLPSVPRPAIDRVGGTKSENHDHERRHQSWSKSMNSQIGMYPDLAAFEDGIEYLNARNIIRCCTSRKVVARLARNVRMLHDETTATLDPDRSYLYQGVCRV